MARPLRIECPGGWYHVTCRGNERRRIFRDDRDRERFLGIVDETRELFGVEVHGYVLMENHVSSDPHDPRWKPPEVHAATEHHLYGLLQPTAPEKRSPLSGPIQGDPD